MLRCIHLRLKITHADYININMSEINRQKVNTLLDINDRGVQSFTWLSHVYGIFLSTDSD